MVATCTFSEAHPMMVLHTRRNKTYETWTLC